MPESGNQVVPTTSKTSTTRELQRYASDGTFLAKLLASEARSDAKCVPTSGKPTETDVVTAAGTVCSNDGAPRRRRRFEEEPVSASNAGNERVKRRTLWDTPAEDERGAASLSAAERERRALSHLKAYDPSPSARDTYEDALESGGLIDGGTWEHRKRAKEIVATSNLSEAINQLHKLASLSGKEAKHSCSIQAYIPSEVLNVVQNKLSGLETDEVKSGTDQKQSGALDELEEKSKIPISESNVGYKLLTKSGWSAGEGLGREGQGITEPIRAVSQTVLGTASTTQVVTSKSSTDSGDPFEAYRQRMMLAYRFRPNPLNNPRRSYDGYKTLYDSKVRNTVLSTLERAKPPTGSSNEGQNNYKSHKV